MKFCELLPGDMLVWSAIHMSHFAAYLIIEKRGNTDFTLLRLWGDNDKIVIISYNPTLNAETDVIPANMLVVRSR
jgi:hypothetical protein